MKFKKFMNLKMLHFNTLESLLNKLIEKLLYPFTNDLPFLLIIFLIYFLPDLCIFLVTGPRVYILYFALYSYIIVYSIVFIADLYLKISKYIKFFILCWFILFALINLFCICIHHTRLNHDIISTIMGTNFSEAFEYFKFQFNFKIFSIAILLVTLIFIILFLLKKILPKQIKKSYSFILFISLLFSSIYLYNLNGAIKKDLSYGWNFSYEDIVDLKHYRHFPKLTFNKDSLPNIVIILGESFTPSHSSLYGYDKNTNPLLSAKLEKGLFPFYKVQAPALFTAAAFKFILNTRLLTDSDTIKWYQYINIFDVLRTVGYKTYWFSSQKEKGLAHNVSSGFSKLCDEHVFTSNLIDGYKLDEELLKYNINSPDSLFAVFYHLMGQHPSFIERYPKEYDLFHKEDYRGEHGDVIAAYDNATLYNDMIVDSIIEKYKNKNVIIFYFSDHGMDIFESTEQYAGHGLYSSQESKKISSHIPFMIFLTNDFQKKYPELVSRIKNSNNKDYCTDKFIYTLMDICGIQFNNNNDVNKYSILR